MQRTSFFPSLGGACALQILCLLLLTATSATAQPPVLDETSTGVDYVIAFPDTTANLTDPRFQNTMYDTLALFIYTAVANDITITSPDGYNKRVTPAAGKFEIVYLNHAQNRATHPITTESGKVTNTTFRVRSTSPIILYCWMSTRFGGEAWTPIPVERWGKEYFAAAVEGSVVIDMDQNSRLDFVKKRKAAPAEIVIVAAYDNTHVTITPNAPLQGNPQLFVTLNKDQVYQLQSRVDTSIGHTGLPQEDIGGSRITADRPIGVLSGNTRQMSAQEGSTITNNAFKNMYVEWLPPTEQMGREFVFMPTFDNQRLTGQQGEKIADKRQFEFVRIYGTSPGNTRIFYRGDSTRVDTFTITQGQVREISIDRPFPHHIRTDKPVQAMMHSSAVLKYNGTIGTIGRGGATYDSWGPYMTELTPREQWGHAACFYVPSQPVGFQNYVNIVADTFALDKIFDENNVPLDFSLGPIPGTDLMWVSYPISSNVVHYFRSIDTTRFFAFVYGVRKGKEEFVPHTTRRKDETPQLQSVAAADYIETIGLSFGYPVNPQRSILRPADSLVIETTMGCSDLSVNVRAVNENPLGLASIRLDPIGLVNARLVLVTPAAAVDLIGRNDATFKVVPINNANEATATVEVTDRTGRRWRIPYRYLPESLVAEPDGHLDFGAVPRGTCVDSVITLRNSLNVAVQLRDLSLVAGNRGFSVVATDPSPLPGIIQPNGTVRLTLRFCPDAGTAPFNDTLQVRLGCTSMKVPVGALETVPCIFVNDLNVGTVFINNGASKTVPLELCNTGSDTVRFTNLSGPDVVTWSDPHFSIPRSTLDSLKEHIRLGPGECTTLQVTFTPTTRGLFRTVAKFWTTTDCGRDTSVWTALVDSLVSGVDLNIAGYTHLRSQPNPADDVATISFRLGRPGATRLVAYDLTGRPIALLVDALVPEGEHRYSWDTSELPTGGYLLRLESGEFRSSIEILITR